MRTVIYNLYSNATATATNQSPVTVIRAGRVRGVAIQAVGTGGAGIGLLTAHAMLNAGADNPGISSTVSRETNLGGIVATMPNAGGFAQNGPFIPANIPVSVGDVLSLAFVVSGTAPASAVEKAQVVVEEN